MAERREINISRYIRFGTATTLCLIDGFLLSQVRNVGIIYQERGLKEGTQNLGIMIGVPLALSGLAYAISRKVEIAAAVGAASYIFHGFLCDFQEFQQRMANSFSPEGQPLLSRLAERIYPDENPPWSQD
ncbi:MAG: hypothetical protein G01um10147_655 [Microgenomates group bacterium Gr01-1014_7]|nr:MAG: hypothetical protein G01um10147_655 [Microgenomates group bacterium Gr01-1014_7]